MTRPDDQHDDYISAWIKSTRGSDPDASLDDRAAMVEGGEDPRFIARRMIVLASEDIGNADPQALPIAVAAAHAVEHVGFPEAEFALAQAAIYLSLAPKSDAVKRAMGEVHGYIREHGTKSPPPALQSAAYPAARKLGAAGATTIRTAIPATSTTRSTCPRASRGCASTSPTRASRRRASAWRRSARRAAGRNNPAVRASRRSCASS